jgi:hypothetical protein
MREGGRGTLGRARSEKKPLEAHADTLKAQLAAVEARAETQAAELGGDLAAETAKTERAIAAFATLVERFDALAAERRGHGGGDWSGRPGKARRRPIGMPSVCAPMVFEPRRLF